MNYNFNDLCIPRTFPINYNVINEKYFFEDEGKIEENLENQLKMLTRKYSERHGVNVSRLTESSETEMHIVGRLYIEEKNDQELMHLEDSTGRILLNLEKIEQYSLFPGQIIMAKGLSDSLEFIVTELYTNTYTNPFANIPKTSNSKIMLGVVAGPFNSPLSLESPLLDFSVFLNFLNQIVKEVNLLIIIGPIVDSENEIIKTGNINIPSLGINDGSFEDIFNALNQYISNISTHHNCSIIYIPHIREMCHVFPLPMPGLKESYQTACECPSSPAYLNIDGIDIDIVPYDIIHEIISGLVIRSKTLVNKISTALDSVFNQYCYMPIIPNSLPVEYSKYDKFCINRIPQIFISTSKMAFKPDMIPGIITVKAPIFSEGNKKGNYVIINISKNQGNFYDSVGIKQFKLI